MTHQFNSLKALLRRVDQKTRHMMLIPVLALMSTAARAELPTMPTPGPGIGGASVGQGDWLGSLGAWFKAGITIFGLVLVGLGFLYVVMGALGRWRDYSKGRADIGELKEYFIMGAVMTVFLVAMVTYAFQTMA